MAKSKKPKTAQATGRTRTSREPLIAFAVASVVGLAMYLVVSNGFFLSARPLLIGVLPGLVVGLVADDLLLSPVSAANAVAFGILLSPPAAIHATDGRTWLVGVGVLSIAVSSAVAWLVTFARSREINALVMTAAGLFLIIAAMWYGAITVAGSTELSGDASLITALEAPVQPYAEMTDPEVYLFVHQRMAQGVAYNEAWNEIITALGDRYEQSAPVKYRLPVLQWFWHLLPASAWSLVIAALAFGTIAAVAAFWFAARATIPALGLVSAAAVATLYLRVASGPYLLQYEGWAAALTLLALALGAESIRASGRKATVLMWSAAAAALLAALTREIATYFLLGALLAAVLSQEGRSKRAWIPWAAALVAVVGVYAAHIASLSSAGYLTSGGFSVPTDYSSPPKGHFAATLAYATWLMGGLPWLPWFAYGLAIAGSFALKGWLKLTSLWAVAAPTAAFVFFSPLTVSGNPAGYWGMLVTPLAFAIAPAVVLFLPSEWRLRLPGLSAAAPVAQNSRAPRGGPARSGG